MATTLPPNSRAGPCRGQRERLHRRGRRG
jgi:hypothetical protein